MKLTLCSAIALSLVLASCTTLDPDYAEYKKKKEAESAAASQSPYGQGADPYGVPGGTARSETGSYAPYQPLPGVNNPGPVSPEPISPVNPSAGGAFPTIPSTPPGSLPTGPTSAHVVAKGDSLWALARRYKTSEEAIRAANGLSSDTIRTGQTLQIPTN